ncbi:MAG: M48 family metalloprotease [Gemmatimonadetes bacterium]|nr:M48 family metalloprotease [Gemmatimonadota bacterium]MDA1103505.1 M48 family metalloprotease [Gemmatimonadota bacterium]
MTSPISDVGLGLVSVVATGWLLTYLLHSTVLIGCACLVTHVLDARAQIADLIWKTALVGGVVSATLAQALVPSRPSTGWVERAPEVVRRVEVLQETTSSVEPSWTGVTAGGVVQVEARLLEPSPECRAALRQGVLGGADWIRGVDESCATPGGLRWFHGLLALWLGGGAVGLAVLAQRHRALSTVLSSQEEVLPGTQALLDQLLEGESGLAVRIGSSERVAGPCVVSGGVIVLPRRCEVELTRAELRAVLAHELAHVARRDFHWLSGIRVGATFLWLQPLNWFAWTRLLYSTELSCDQRAVTRTGERMGLATAIARVAEWVTPALAVRGAIFMTGRSRTGLSDRVALILRPRPSSSESRWLLPAVALLMLGPLLLLPVVPAPSTQRASITIRESREVVRLSAETNGAGRIEFSEHRVLVAAFVPADTLP